MNVPFQIKNETILLRADSMNYELCRRKFRTDKDTGEKVEEWEPFKFFSTLEQALNRIIDLKVRASEARTLKELLLALETARQDVCGLWRTGP